VSVHPQSFVVTVIVQFPIAFAVTTPEELTDAIEELLELQVTVLLLASLGDTVAIKLYDCPTVKVIESAFKVTSSASTVPS
jgi:hypothetical protein